MVVMSVLEQQRDATREHRRLARPGTRDDEQSRTAVSDGVGLLGIQSFEERIGGIDCGGRVRHVGSSLRAPTDTAAKGE